MPAQRLFLVLMFAWVAAVGAGTRSSAQQPPAQNTAPPFEGGIELVTVNVTVTDTDGHLVTGLNRDAFEILEDAQQQTITQFTNERMPISLGVLLDISDSMFGKRIQDARAAIDSFLFDRLGPDDEFFVLAFNHMPRVLTRWTRDNTTIKSALEGLKPFGSTAARDALVASMPLVAERSNQRAALVLISDGADNASDVNPRDLRTALLKSDTFVYAVAIDSPDRQPINTRINTQALREIAAENGGRVEVVQNTSDLAAATASIADELKSQYLLGYTSTRGIDGQFHSIRVRVAGTSYRVRARTGYIAITHAKKGN